MAPWHRTRYFNSLRQQERIQRRAITAMNKKSETAGSGAGSKGLGGGGGSGGGGGGEGMVGDLSDNMKVIQHDNKEESHATMDNGLQIDQEMVAASFKSDMIEQKDVGTRENYAESKEGVEKEENQTGRGGEGTGEGGGGGGGAGDVDTEDEEDVTDYQWKDEDDDEEDDSYDTVLPLMEDLEDDVSLPRLFGGHCSVNMFLEDNHHTPSTPASTAKYPQSLSKPRSGSISNEPKKRKRASSGGGKAKAVPKTVPAPKGRVGGVGGGGAGTGAGKIVLHEASAAPDAGQRAEAGDLSGLLVNGLFMSSVLIVDAYLVAKDAAIEKVRTVLYCTVLYCTVLYCTVLYCTVLSCTVLYCTILHCTALYCIHVILFS